MVQTKKNVMFSNYLKTICEYCKEFQLPQLLRSKEHLKNKSFRESQNSEYENKLLC